MSLRHTTALITGGSGGIGLGISKAFANAGARIVVLSHKKEEIDAALSALPERAEGDEPHQGIVHDVTSAEAPSGVNFSEVDVLVNCAGIAHAGLLSNTEAKDIQNVVNVNLVGTMFMTKFAMDAWQKRYTERAESDRKAEGNGCIINISSILGLRAVSPGLSVYAATKAALIMFTKSMCVEGGRVAVRSNAICPGYVRTEMTKSQELSFKTPLQEVDDTGDVSVESIANAAMYFATNPQVSGSILSVDKGICAN
ncbi:3-oxoacyl-[acyl-carrier-protein] reductase FabG [Yarrowia sp. C11]|nr:3-oxoacyl-[acyl-carrier-protein] reductase FabG [Yarrowia sp. E02]KAG5371358.1 3-oxoacyl-[acyl-carrier-protein] reductase FabG [Yarrowia sp. C11]